MSIQNIWSPIIMGNWRHFLELVEILNEIEENFSLRKDHDAVIQFWSFKTIITELKKKLIIPKESTFIIS